MTPHEQVSKFNAKVGWGDGVLVQLEDRTISTTTRALAQVLHDGRAVIWVDGHTGAVDLNCVRPDGRKSGTFDLAVARRLPKESETARMARLRAEYRHRRRLTNP